VRSSSPRGVFAKALSFSAATGTSNTTVGDVRVTHRQNQCGARASNGSDTGAERFERKRIGRNSSRCWLTTREALCVRPESHRSTPRVVGRRSASPLRGMLAKSSRGEDRAFCRRASKLMYSAIGLRRRSSRQFWRSNFRVIGKSRRFITSLRQALPTSAISGLVSARDVRSLLIHPTVPSSEAHTRRTGTAGSAYLIAGAEHTVRAARCISSEKRQPGLRSRPATFTAAARYARSRFMPLASTAGRGLGAPSGRNRL